LGKALRVGNTVFGYDLSTMNIEFENENMNERILPDIILVKKNIDRKSGGYKRIWKLKRMEAEGIIREEKISTNK